MITKALLENVIAKYSKIRITLISGVKAEIEIPQMTCKWEDDCLLIEGTTGPTYVNLAAIAFLDAIKPESGFNSNTLFKK